jgi:GNAT superfamily N-acetyltransferase
MNIRIAVAEDAPNIAHFQEAHALEVEGLKLEPATVLLGVQRIFQLPTPGFFLVADAEATKEQSSRHSLAACLLVLSEWSEWRACDVWWIHSVYVDHQARGKRLFDALYFHVEALARERGVAGIRLYVDKRNTTAKRVYERLGMSNEHYELYERLF